MTRKNGLDMENRYLYFSVFFSGMTTLAIELSASRLMGSVFGTSNLVWASIIGLILIYLTLGYFIGGLLADRSPNQDTFYTILAWGAFTSGIIPFISRPVLVRAANAFDYLEIGVLLGSFLTVMILFTIPVTLLGAISPFAIRLSLSDSNNAGIISGRIYAISTLGSFVGTFLPVLVLIPLIGTKFTFLSFGIMLLIVSYFGLWKSNGFRSVLKNIWMFVILIVLGLFFGTESIKETKGQIFEVESAYNYIQVLDVDGYRYLRLNEGQGIHSIYHPDDIVYYGPWMQVLSAPFFNLPPHSVSKVERIAIIGLAAGTIAQQSTQAFGPIPIVGFEIDPKIIEVGQEYFNMNLPNLEAIAVDGRLGLSKSKDSYSIISVDAYRPPYIPWHLTTQEFFQLAFDHLDDDGVLVVNVGRAPDDRRLINGLVGTIGSVFPSVYVMDIPNTFNSIIYATVRKTSEAYLYENVAYLLEDETLPPILLSALKRTVANLKPLPETSVVFTDDKAPIEWMTNNMVVNYLLHGDMDSLQ